MVAVCITQLSRDGLLTINNLCPHIRINQSVYNNSDKKIQCYFLLIKYMKQVIGRIWWCSLCIRYIDWSA
uniref:Uncharacterized protein n=1 Tax=Pararge aegeria TaxID=116150 RepID=S4P6Y9_9NEOP